MYQSRQCRSACGGVLDPPQPWHATLRETAAAPLTFVNLEEPQCVQHFNASVPLKETP